MKPFAAYVRSAALLSIVLLWTACRAPVTPPVVLLTDFGLQNDAVGLMRGVIHTIAPGAPVSDLTHEVARFDVEEGARRLVDAPAYYPPGSVFVVVVDPGVGTARRAIAVRLGSGSVIVAPDNGVVTRAAERHGPVEVREVVNADLVLGARSATFHGRDVFAPVGAHLAAGVPFEEVGPVITDWIRLHPASARQDGRSVLGVIEDIDEPFGNLWTNVPADWLRERGVVPGDVVEVLLGSQTFQIPWVATFGAVPAGAPLIYENSRGKLSLALNQGDFARTHDLRPGAGVRFTP